MFSRISKLFIQVMRKKRIFLVLVAVLLMAFLTVATAQVSPYPEVLWVTGHWEVTPTGAYPEDQEHVQWAVDQGGKVLLKAGTFNFGEYITQLEQVVPGLPPFVVVVQNPGSVEVGRNGQSVEIEGETDKHGNLLTKIWGGHWTIYSMNHVQMAVRNIEFEDSGDSAIAVAKSTGVEISGCKITKLRYGQVYIPFLKRAVPITIVPVTPDWESGPPEDITGNVVIKDNYIRGFETYEPYDADIQFGVILQTIDATAEISNNEIYNCSAYGLVVSSNQGTTTISDNVIHPGYLSTSYLPNLGYAIGNGIYILADWSQGSVLATRNQIHCTSPSADGIAVEGSSFGESASLVFSNNRVFLENSENGGLSCYFGVNNSVWTNNKVEGTMSWAIGIMPDDYTAEYNVFQGNNIATIEPYDADSAHVIFMAGANYNTVIGYTGNVINYGYSNILTGGQYTLKPLGPELAQRLTDALAAKKDWPF